MNVLWEADSELTLSQIAQRVEEKYLRQWRPHQVKRIINNIIRKGALESYRAGQEVKYRVTIEREDYKSSLLSKMGDQVFDGAVFDYMAALTVEDELSDREFDDLKELINELDHRKDKG